MKKVLSIVLSAMLLLALASVVLADSNLDCDTPWVDIEELAPDALADMFGDSYPYSVDYDWPECKSDPVIKGTVIAGVGPDGTTHCWSNGTDNASCAFDGDTITFYDPYEASTQSWVGLRLDQPYELTEVRICNRSGQESRIIGAAIQGSNDNGATWHNVVWVDPSIYGHSALLMNDYHIITPEPNQEYIDIYKENAGLDDKQADFSQFWVGHGSYSMYRYVSLGGGTVDPDWKLQHGDCAEIELYGHPADAYVGDEMAFAEAEKNTAEYYPNPSTFVGTKNYTADGSVSGRVLGAGGAWSDGSSYECAWDGDPSTYYDPASAGLDCWTAILADQATVLTEVRVMPRANVDLYPRTGGAAIQGSNDGVHWTTLVQYDPSEALAADAEQAYIPKAVEGADAYWLFRYVSLGYDETNDAGEVTHTFQHGDVAEILLFGTAGEATLEYEAPAVPTGDMLKCDGKEYDEAAAAAKGIGSKPITKYEFVEGADVHFNNEGPENLWDDDVTTKFCTNGFPAWSVAQTDGKYSINGIVMATANDNSSNPGRAPGLWTIYGSNDNAGWDVIATGDDTFFTEVAGDVDYTFFAASIEPTAAYSYFKFECTETPVSLMQVSEVVLCSADAPEAETPAPVEEKVEEVKEEVTEAVEEVKEDVTEAAEAVGDAVSEAANDAANAVTDAANNAVQTAKSGCGSFIGGGLIVLVTLLGSAWISRRK